MNTSGPQTYKTRIHRSLLGGIVSIAVLSSAGVAHSGPCTAQIAQLERRIAGAAPGPNSGPMAPQTLGAQLHRQPTPGSIARAEKTANKDADAAVDRARKADAAGDAYLCKAALEEARRLYDLE